MFRIQSVIHGHLDSVAEAPALPSMLRIQIRQLDCTGNFHPKFDYLFNGQSAVGAGVGDARPPMGLIWEGEGWKRK